MVKRGTEIEGLRRLIVTLEQASRKNGAAIWKKLAFLLSKPTRKKAEVNLNKLNRILNDGEVAAIPGKVLGMGKLEKEVKIAAFRFSKSAAEKLKKTGIETMSLEKLIQTNPKGSKVRVVI